MKFFFSNLLHDVKFYPVFVFWKSFQRLVGINLSKFRMPIRVKTRSLTNSIKFCQNFFNKKIIICDQPVYCIKLHGKTINVNFKSLSERDFEDNETFQQFLRLKWINDEVIDSNANILGLSEKYSLLLLFLKLFGLKILIIKLKS